MPTLALLVVLVPISALDKGGSFAAAFAYVGMPWAQHIVALGEFQGSRGVECALGAGLQMGDLRSAGLLC